MMRHSRPYPCVGIIISSPNTRTWVLSSKIFRHDGFPSKQELIEIIAITIDIIGNVVAVPCEANFLNNRKPPSLVTSSRRYLVRAACRAVSKDGLHLNIRSTVQHVSRSLASERSTVARERSRDASRTKLPDSSWFEKSMKSDLKSRRHSPLNQRHVRC
jgi:hypothetical protein